MPKRERQGKPPARRRLVAQNICIVIPGRRGSGEPGIQTASPPEPQPGFRVRAKTRAPE
jgi:hypothetical protein